MCVCVCVCVCVLVSFFGCYLSVDGIQANCRRLRVAKQHEGVGVSAWLLDETHSHEAIVTPYDLIYLLFPGSLSEPSDVKGVDGLCGSVVAIMRHSLGSQPTDVRMCVCVCVCECECVSE